MGRGRAWVVGRSERMNCYDGFFCWVAVALVWIRVPVVSAGSLGGHKCLGFGIL